MFKNSSKINPDKNKTSKRKPLPESNLGKRENNTANIHVGKGQEMGQNASTPLTLFLHPQVLDQVAQSIYRSVRRKDTLQFQV
jgi:hypothetical protein